MSAVYLTSPADVASVLNDVVATFAVLAGLVAGLWAYRTYRRSRPNCTVEHHVAYRRVGDCLVVRVSIKMRNLGLVLLTLTRGRVRLYDMSASQIGTEPFPPLTGHQGIEIPWPVLNRYRLLFEPREGQDSLEAGQPRAKDAPPPTGRPVGAPPAAAQPAVDKSPTAQPPTPVPVPTADLRVGRRQIEPGERDELEFDFIVPNAAAIDAVGVYSFFENRRGGTSWLARREAGGRLFGWSTTTLHNVEKQARNWVGRLVSRSAEDTDTTK